MAKSLLLFVGRPLCSLQTISVRQAPFAYCIRNRELVGVLQSLGKIKKYDLIQWKSYCSASGKKSENKSLQQQETSSGVSEDVKPITFKTVKETTKTAGYLGVMLVGVGVTCLMFYATFNELFSSKSPNNVYSKALDRVCADTRVQDALGEPISGYGEENRRGRRQHVSHLVYNKDGEIRMRMKFYISGSRKRATVHLEMRENESGRYEYRYLFVELDDFGRHPIVFEDNRNSPAGRSPSSGLSRSNEELDFSAPLNMNLNFPDAEVK